MIPRSGKKTLPGLEIRTSRPAASIVVASEPRAIRSERIARWRPRAMPVLVAPDSFKGTMAARIVAAAIGRGLERAGLRADLAPVADGGEGTMDVLLERLGGELVTLTRERSARPPGRGLVRAPGGRRHGARRGRAGERPGARRARGARRGGGLERRDRRARRRGDRRRRAARARGRGRQRHDRRRAGRDRGDRGGRRAARRADRRALRRAHAVRAGGGDVRAPEGRGRARPSRGWSAASRRSACPRACR